MSNSLAKVHPELVSEWSERNFPLTPDNITYGSNKRVWWKGSCGHEWQASVKARSKGEGCPICSGARVVEGINDLATVKPKLSLEWSEKNTIKPTEVTAGSHKKVIWKCEHGHEWTATVKSRTINKTGCPYCSHNKVLAGFNDLASQYPDIAAEWSDRNLPLSGTLATKLTDVINETMNDPTVGILHHDEGVDLVPANLELSAMEFNLVNAMSRETALRNYLSEVKDKYDYILIDCMPSLGMVTINALSAADSVIIPVQAQYLPAKGMTQLVQTISRVKKRINPGLKIDGMLLTLVDSRTNLAKSTVEALRENFGSQIKMYRTYIPIAVKAAETSSKGKSIFAYEPNSTVSKAYTEFTKEVLADGRKKERLHSHEAR